MITTGFYQRDDLRLWLAWSSQGLCYVGLPHTNEAARHVFLTKTYPNAVVQLDDPRSSAMHNQLDEYFAGIRTRFETALDLQGSAFQQSVWQALRHIPYGQIWTYAEVAKAVGRPSAIRAVSNAIGQNPVPIVVPCHRVIGSNGTLTGYHGGLRMKERLLHCEGITEYRAVGHRRFEF